MKLNVFAERKLHALKAKKNWMLILIAISFVISLALYFVYGFDKQKVWIAFFSALSILCIAEHHFLLEIELYESRERSSPIKP